MGPGTDEVLKVIGVWVTLTVPELLKLTPVTKASGLVGSKLAAKSIPWILKLL